MFSRACRLLEVALVELQRIFAELARHQTDGEVELAIGRRAGNDLGLPVEPLGRRGWKLSTQPVMQKRRGTHATSVSGCLALEKM